MSRRPHSWLTTMVTIGLVAAALLGGPVERAAASRFTDVPAGAGFATEIEWVASEGISTGWPDNTFRPLEPVQRNAMAAFLYRLAGSPDFVAPDRSPFTDIAPGDDFYLEMTWLADMSIATGWPDGTFRPMATITRDAMAAFMYRLARNNPISFTDPSLQACITSSLGINTTVIGRARAGAITELNCPWEGITSLTGLSALTRLRELGLYHNQVTDLSPLTGLSDLTILDVGSNRVSDLSALSGLSALTELSVDDNQLVNLAPLSGLSRLTQLLATGNQIADLAPLSGLTGLRHLYLDSNNVTSAASISGLTGLVELDLSSNELSDLRPLSGMTDLTGLYLNENLITDVRPLAGLSRLTVLSLMTNQITDASSLDGLAKLTDLYLQLNPLCDTDPGHRGCS